MCFFLRGAEAVLSGALAADAVEAALLAALAAPLAACRAAGVVATSAPALGAEAAWPPVEDAAPAAALSFFRSSRFLLSSLVRELLAFSWAALAIRSSVLFLPLSAPLDRVRASGAAACADWVSCTCACTAPPLWRALVVA